MRRVKDVVLEIRIYIALMLFISAQRSGKSSRYELMHHYFDLCNQRSQSQIDRQEKRFM